MIYLPWVLFSTRNCRKDRKTLLLFSGAFASLAEGDMRFRWTKEICTPVRFCLQPLYPANSEPGEQISHWGDKRLRLIPKSTSALFFFFFFNNSIQRELGATVFTFSGFDELFMELKTVQCRWVFPSHLDQEEGDAVRPQGSSQLDVLHFCFDLGHLSTVFVFLQVGLKMDSSSELIMNL